MKSLKYLFINTLAFFIIIGIGTLGHKYLHWGDPGLAGGLGNLFTSAMVGLLVPVIISYFVVRKHMIDFKLVFIFHMLLNFIYSLIWLSIFV
jgi:hypothetical protein